MLLLTDDDVTAAIDPERCIDAMERAFGALRAGGAVNRPRVRFTCASPTPGMQYFSNVHTGAVPVDGVACVRIDSNLLNQGQAEGRRNFRKPIAKNWGLVLLYSVATGELLAIMPDFTLSGMRVAATSALAARYLARPGASTLGLYGTGKQARSHLAALRAVRPLERARVYSPSEAHREAFAADFSRDGLTVEAVSEPEAAADGADIVCCCTNSLEPVFRGGWFAPGQLLITIENSDPHHFKTEVDRDAIVRSDQILITDRESVEVNRQRELTDPIEAGEIGWDRIHELAELVDGSWRHAHRPDERVYYKNNTGMAIQFAAAGAVIHGSARERGLGREFPTDWFSTDLTAWYDRGYAPSS